MISFQDIHNFYFLGIGGIGMSALARYFHQLGYPVFGYDRTPSSLTRELEKEGIKITFEDRVKVVQSLGLSRINTVVIRTPAVPDECEIYCYLREQGFEIYKRAEILGMVTRQMKALCVAGTHGKTTTSTLLAHLLTEDRQDALNSQGEGGKGERGEGEERKREGEEGKGAREVDACPHGVNAFLGGISMNYGTNLLVDKKSDYVVVEADEYDRSFHQLTPYISVVTAVDPDHLDIYGTAEAYRDAFAHYTSLITGALVMKKGIELTPRLQSGVKLYTYGVVENEDLPHSESDLPDFYASHIRMGDGQIVFDFHTPESVVKDVRLGVPVWINIENSVAAMSVAWLTGQKPAELKAKAGSFKGVLRRFNIHVNSPKVAYIDDYAHHPDEIATAIDSIRKLFPQRRLIGVFQPHLYTRTRDFAQDFARVLGTLDELILLPIYPAREKPIPGITSELLGGQVVEKKDLVKVLKEKVKNATEPLVILTVGAGDIDRLVPNITQALNE